MSPPPRPDPVSPPGDGGLAALRGTLLGLGCTADELARAEREGTLPLLAVERLIVPDVPVHDLDAVVERTGLDPAHVLDLWRTLGYPVPRPGEVAFTDTDVEILGEISRFMASDLASAALVMQMSRVIGSSMARIASAQVDALSARARLAARQEAAGELSEAPSEAPSDERVVASARALLPIVPRVLAAAWRRHLQAAVRRRLSMAEAGEGPLGVVGFADLVGFTALSQQVGDDELTAIVDQFEQLAFDVVTANDGRVVKMIGDEVMFTVDSPAAAAEIGLALAEGTRGADELSDLRVGLAHGPLLEREGDLYGPVVNLASRITAIAFPGSIVVSESLRDRLRDHPDYRLRSMRPRHLKDIGRVPLWVLRRAAPAESRFAPRRRALRAAVRARVEPDEAE
ncbi:MAG TPA: adenylate/guanylate cyclase domain-containing protein [Acidimicrobiales bacterium]|nr:adenylate/guanylate cyclase domain-containing protein [Acidimicrobiales bacterium]